MSSTSEYQLKRPLTFLLPDNASFDSTLVLASLILSDEEEDDCQIVVQVALDIYRNAIVKQGLFHIHPALRLQGSDEDFEAGNPVEITLRLDRRLRAQVIDELRNGEDLAHIVLNGAPEALQEPRAWYAMKVMQEVDVPPDVAEGTVKSGYKTVWAGEPTGDIFAAAVEFLLDEEWPIERPDESTVLTFVYEGDSGDFECKIEARELHRIAAVYSHFPQVIPEDRIAAIGEFVARVNYGMPVGNFELDWDNGKIRYKTSVDVEGDRMSSALMHNLVVPNVMAMEFYMPAIVACMKGTSPIDALIEIEENED